MQVLARGEIPQVEPSHRGQPTTQLGKLARKGALLLGLVTAVLAWPGLVLAADASDLSKETAACLACHDREGMAKKLENGDLLPLRVSTRAFLDSKHNATDCSDCHSSLDDKTHGKTATPVESRRAYAMGMQQACQDCHKKTFKAYEESLHARLAHGNNPSGERAAPLCADCHNPHEVKSTKEPVVLNSLSCARCHEGVLQAYAGDVHGRAYQAKLATAPICASCHQAHAIKAAALNFMVRDACLVCHKAAAAKHKEWLPNTARHFDAVSCPVCHAPGAERRVNLRLYDKAQGGQVLEKVGVPHFEKKVGALDSSNAGLEEQALAALLKEYNAPDKPANIVLRGRLEVSSGPQAHQLADKAHAIKDCATCHKAGAQAFQSVSLTIAGPDGRPLRHALKKEVLTSLLATESVSGFYAIGSTRIVLLDVLFVLVLLGAASVPLMHGSAKVFFAKQREKRIRAEAAAAAANESTRDE